MKFKTLIPVLSIVAMGAAAGEPPTAQSQSQPPTFETLDTNHNNLIDPSESKQMPKLASAFSSADANHDGNLDKKEYDKAVAQMEQGARATGRS